MIHGGITDGLDLVEDKDANGLQIKVKDPGVRVNTYVIESILRGHAISSNSKSSENAYGFSLALEKHLLERLKGMFILYQRSSDSATFEVKLPQSPEQKKQYRLDFG